MNKLVWKKLVKPSWSNQVGRTGKNWSTQVGRTGCEKACSRREYERAEEVVPAGRILAAHLGSSSGKPCCIIAQPSTPPIIIIVIITHSTTSIILTQALTNDIQIVITIYQNSLTLHVITITIETAIMVDQKSYFRGERFLTYSITICVAPIVKICRTSLLPLSHIIGMLLQAGWSTGRPISVSFLIWT